MTSPSPLRARGLQLLRQAVGDPAADFRDGQWEAIEALVQHRARLLLVQRTGWGKSAVYFLSTRLLRDLGAGPTLLVSPLLALMRNQIDAAARLGVRAETVNSTNREDWGEVDRRLHANEIDVLVVSPERFANDEFLTGMLLPHAARVGLFVVDEAHCISDWGHDFRPDYRRIVRILERLPANVSVCTTTATANNRVVADVVSQLGPNLEVCRGPLVRDSVRLQTVALPDDAAKLAWLAHHLPRLPGSGIVYALTIRWTERIAQWLQSQGVNAVAYSAELANEDRQEREGRLLRNEVKALVATTALGMGYDKPDLGFVVHFHQPASVVHYYQQVGRAGRSVSRAYGIMLSGGDDGDINDYFIQQAFPPEEHVVAILHALEQSEHGLTMAELEAAVNLSRSRIEQVLKTLAVETPAPLARLESRWVTTPHRYDPERRRRLVEHLTRLRREEQVQMDAYRCHTGCLMEFLARALSDPAARPCGHCAPCQGKPEVLRDVPTHLTHQAVAFLRRSDLPIEPRRRWQPGALPLSGWSGSIGVDHAAEPGRALCILGDAGWGNLVRQGKYQDGRFADELVEALASLVRGWRPNPAPTCVTCVPSLNHPGLVPDLAKRLAARLSLPFIPTVRKVRPTRPQKEMENSWQQAHNLDGAFEIHPGIGRAGPVLLVDDIVDSRWTFTVVAALLRQAGSGPVFPLALAANR
ncbi:MAG: RecQ family ATP-dependent DNA helicase [Gemmataceae bacterium]|nr:RecQ family ATP-dependent DNA helicase [Gemmataceae bacterium]